MPKACPKCSTPVTAEDFVCPGCRTILLGEDEEFKDEQPSDEPLPPGTLIAGDYEIVQFLGKGGAGKVYEARQLSLRNMRVALKILHRDLNENEAVISLMKREVIISRELTHDNVIKIYNLERSDDLYCIVMEYVAGRSLQTILNLHGNFTAAVMGAVLVQVCDALHYAHSRGVIHLDIKPANILIGGSGNVKVVDFGIARMAFGATSTATQRLVIGSIGFMPPEQLRGRREVSPQSDIYALAATVYYCLTGRIPMGNAVRADVAPPCVVKALNQEPSERFQDVRDFLRAYLGETGLDQHAVEQSRAALASLVGNSVSPRGGESAENSAARGQERRFHEKEAPHSTGAETDQPIYLSKIDLAHDSKLEKNLPARLSAPPAAQAPEKTPAQATHEAASTWKKRALIGVCSALVVSLLLAATILLISRRSYDPTVRRFDVDTVSMNWKDPVRNRETPVKIYFPKNAKEPAPAVVFSHGMGGNRDSAEYAGRHWAARGYVSVHLQHKGSDTPVLRLEHRPLDTLRRLLPDRQVVVERIQDISFAADQLTKPEGLPYPAPRIDPEKLGVAGHSLGAMTALAVSGQVFFSPTGEEQVFVDPRFKAATLMSPAIRPNQLPFIDQAFLRIINPMLHLAGAKDHTPLGETRPEDRTLVYNAVNSSDQFLVVFRNADQFIFGGRQAAFRELPGDKELTTLIASVSACFWDAYLKNDIKAQKWLQNFSKELGDKGTFEYKLHGR
jgi:serine/threonine protein kinase/alpha-beta hydrolase superfamily lysophospholipase